MAEADHVAVLVAAGGVWVRVEQVEIEGWAMDAAEFLRPGSQYC